MEIVASPSTDHLLSSDILSSISLQGSPALVLDAIKRGEDDEDVSRGDLPVRKGRSIMLRLYESLGGRATGSISLGKILGVKRVFKTNVLEDDEEEVVLQDGFGVVLHPFEVSTFRLQL